MDEEQPVPDDEQGSWELVDRGETRPAHAKAALIVAVVLIIVVLVGILAFAIAIGSALQTLNGI